MKLFKQNKQKHYTVAGMMADLAKEKQLAAVDDIDLQSYIDYIQNVAESGRYKCDIRPSCPNNSMYLVMPKIKTSLERLGFKVDWNYNNSYLTVSW